MIEIFPEGNYKFLFFLFFKEPNSFLPIPLTHPLFFTVRNFIIFFFFRREVSMIGWYLLPIGLGLGLPITSAKEQNVWNRGVRLICNCRNLTKDQFYISFNSLQITSHLSQLQLYRDLKMRAQSRWAKPT